MEEDPVLNEIVEPYLHPKQTYLISSDRGNLSKTAFEEGAFEFDRGKRGALQLGLMMNCATGCDPLSYQGYGCFCGFMGAGDPMDGIDM